MYKTISSFLLGAVCACSLTACSSTPMRRDEVASCQQTGLTDAQDSKIGPLDCTRRDQQRAAAK